MSMAARDHRGGPVVGPARKSDIPHLARALADAFDTSATFTWIVADDAARARLLGAMFTGMLRHQHPVATGALAARLGENIAGAAVWAPPGRWQAPWWRNLLMAPTLVRTVDRQTLRAFGTRGREVDRALAAAHPVAPHWYLAVLGVTSVGQGSGAGSALLRAGLARAAAQGYPAYLECEERLIPYYERFGFRTRASITVPPTAPAQVGMWWSGPATGPGER